MTTADVLEALYQATHLPIVADYYTHLFPAQAVSPQDQPLFDALNQLAGTMRLRWRRDGRWLQFRTVSYYDDRLKEVPHRLLSRWAELRRQKGALTLDELTEIAQLSDAQLDAADMAEGARECWGLAEWEAARNPQLRPHWRFLASFTPEQRQAVLGPDGLPFSRLSRAQQQQFIGFAFGARVERLEDLATATVQATLIPQGWFQWAREGSTPSPLSVPPVLERTREAALQAARRIDPQALDAQIVPTEWSASVLYVVGPPNHRYATCIVQVSPHGGFFGGP